MTALLNPPTLRTQTRVPPLRWTVKEFHDLGEAGAFENRSKQWNVSSRRSCAPTASAISARPWPTLQCHRHASPSTYRRPSSSHTSAPSPRTSRRYDESGAAGDCA